METKKLYDIHADHKEWLNKLAFYADDIKVIRHRIEEVASKNTSKDILAQVEHFQNQLIIQKNEIDKLNHDIKLNEEMIQKSINENPTAADHRSAAHNPKEKDAVETFEKLFNEMRREVYAFLSKVM